jgi:hypothetical protein
MGKSKHLKTGDRENLLGHERERERERERVGKHPVTIDF